MADVDSVDMKSDGAVDDVGKIVQAGVMEATTTMDFSSQPTPGQAVTSEVDRQKRPLDDGRQGPLVLEEDDPTTSGHDTDDVAGTGGHDSFTVVNRRKKKFKGKGKTEPFAHKLANSMKNNVEARRTLTPLRPAPVPKGPPPSTSAQAPLTAPVGTTPGPGPQQSVMRRTLLVRLPREFGRLYVREHFMTAFQEVGLEMRFIEALGTLNSNSEWHVTLTTDAPETLLSNLCLKPLMIRGKRAQVSPIMGGISRVRVHWAPYFLPSELICAALCQAGQVLGGEFERSITKGMEHVKTLIRIYQVKCLPEAIPHTVTVTFQGRQFPLLLTVPGRPPMCLKCHKVGHIRKECETPFCRHCQEYGHLTELCAASNTYAGRVKKTQQSGAAGVGDAGYQDECAVVDADGGKVAVAESVVLEVVQDKEKVVVEETEAKDGDEKQATREEGGLVEDMRQGQAGGGESSKGGEGSVGQVEEEKEVEKDRLGGLDSDDDSEARYLELKSVFEKGGDVVSKDIGSLQDWLHSPSGGGVEESADLWAMDTRHSLRTAPESS
jgi:hypothetical protein